MNSKKSFAGRLMQHDIAVSLRVVAPVMLVFLVVFTIMGAVSTAAIPDISIFNLEHTHNQLKFRLWTDALTYPVVIAAVLFGAVTAFVAFRFLLIKVQTTAYLSLPLSRLQISLTRIVVSAFGMLAVLALAFSISAVLNVAALGVWQGEALQIVYVVLGLFVCAIVGYAIMLFGLLFAGTQVEALLFGVSLLAAVSVASVGINVLMSHLLVGSTAGVCLIGTQIEVAPSLLSDFATCNPLLFFAGSAAQHQSFSVVAGSTYVPGAPSWGLLGAWLLFAVVLLAANMLLFCRRPGEKAGIAGLCPIMTAVFALVTGLLVFSAVFAVLADIDTIWAVVAGLACFAVVCGLLLWGPLKGIMAIQARVGILGGEAAVLLIVVAVLSTGAFGWSARVPQAPEVEQVAISYAGDPSMFPGETKSASSSSQGAYMSGTLTSSEADDIELAIAVNKELAAKGKAPLAVDAQSFGDTVVAYDVQIEYQLADGSLCKRYYDRASLEDLASLTKLEDSQRMSALRAALVDGKTKGLADDDATAVSANTTAKAFSQGSIYLADSNLSTPLQLNVTPDARKSLLKALSADMKNQSSQDRYYPRKGCSAVMFFSLNGGTDTESFSWQPGDALVFLDSSCPKTMKWLEDKGLSELLKAKSSDIKKMIVVRYDPYARKSINGVAPMSQYFTAYRSDGSDDFMVAPEYGSRVEVTDKKQLREVTSKLRSNYYMDGGGYFVCAYLKSSDSYSYFFLPQADAPQWLVQQVG